ncbi:MAG TPA: SPOR domain-containing protein [Gammaproteobacteria bacterium]|nr:SPOR domain-containing protein [Gammaproteobacteria bacterium]
MLNRIIGILVVLAIGVLSYPFFNSRPSFAGHTEAIQMPPFPSAYSQSDTIKALTKQEVGGVNKAQILQLASSKQKFSSTEIKAFKNIGWVIQVGTYNNKTTALSLVNQLRAKGYKAFIHQTRVAFGKEVQVYIGPEIKKDAATLLASKLAKETKLTVTVKTYKLLSA